MQLNHYDAAFEIKDVSEAGVFHGYGSVYNVTDQGDDIVAANAFSDSLNAWAAKGALPAMLWQHRSGEPIGAYTAMSEDSRGLQVSGQLALKTQRGAEAYALMTMKPRPAISGLSIGFMTRDDSFDHVTGVRTIKKADLWEVSLVTFPQNDAARVDSVKSIPEFNGISDFERFLRDVANLSRADAVAVVAKAKTLFLRDAVNVECSNAIFKAFAERTLVNAAIALSRST